MPYGTFDTQAIRLPLTALVLLASVYLLTGVTHGPWQGEDAIHIGIAHSMLADGQWLLPHIAGEPWPHTPPLYHWLAATLGHLLADWLPFHDAARLASPLFGALFLFALAGTARTFYGIDACRMAPLLAIGTLGLLVSLHETQPAAAGLAFAAIAWWGGGLTLQGKRFGSVLLGVGIGMAFATHGLAGLVMAIAVLPAPILRGDLKNLLVALLLALMLAAAWPLLLFSLSPELWPYWLQWWQNEFAEATLGRSLPNLTHLEQLLWATWPILPIASWSLWLHRRDPVALALPLLGCLTGMAWYLSGSSRTLSMLPAIIPLILLAAAGAGKLRRGAANAFDWFGVMTFSFCILLIWLGASAQSLGWPAAIARNFNKLAPGHMTEYPLPLLAFAVLLSLAWIAVWRLPRAPWRAMLRWAVGTTVMWALMSTLWLAWIDHYKSYRPVIASLQAALPQDIDCIQRSGLGVSHLASLDTLAGIRTVSVASARHCHWQLVAGERDRAVPSGWAPVWQAQRARDRKESWFLYRRDDLNQTAAPHDPQPSAQETTQ